MQPNPQRTDPQSQGDVPPQSGTNVNAQPAVPRAGQMVPPESLVPGADVYGMEGTKVGTVREVYNDSFLVHKGSFLPHDYYIPYRYVARATNDEVNLTLVSHEVPSQNWSQRPGATSGAQTSLDYGTDYGRAGSSDTIQDATNGGLQDDLGGSLSPSNADPDQWESDAQGMRDI